MAPKQKVSKPANENVSLGPLVGDGTYFSPQFRDRSIVLINILQASSSSALPVSLHLSMIPSFTSPISGSSSIDLPVIKDNNVYKIYKIREKTTWLIFWVIPVAAKPSAVSPVE